MVLQGIGWHGSEAYLASMHELGACPAPIDMSRFQQCQQLWGLAPPVASMCTGGPVPHVAPVPQQQQPVTTEEEEGEEEGGDKQIRWQIRQGSSALAILEHVYALDPFPGLDARRELAKQLNVSPRQIQVWFQNKRQRERKMSRAKGEKKAPGLPETHREAAARKTDNEAPIETVSAPMPLEADRPPVTPRDVTRLASTFKRSQLYDPAKETGVKPNPSGGPGALDGAGAQTNASLTATPSGPARIVSELADAHTLTGHSKRMRSASPTPGQEPPLACDALAASLGAKMALLAALTRSVQVEMRLLHASQSKAEGASAESKPSVSDIATMPPVDYGQVLDTLSPDEEYEIFENITEPSDAVPTLHEMIATEVAPDMNSEGGSFSGCSFSGPKEASDDSAAGIGQPLPPVIGEGAQPESMLVDPHFPATVPPAVNWLETSKAWSDTQYQMLIEEEQVVWTTNAWRQLLTGDGEPNGTGPWPDRSLLQLIQGPLTDKAAVAEVLRALRTGERTVVSMISHTLSGRPFSHNISLKPLEGASATRSFQAISSDVKFLALSEEQLARLRGVMLRPCDASSAAPTDVAPAPLPRQLLSDSVLTSCHSVVDMLSWVV